MNSSQNITPIAVFWFRRDLRLHDNSGLFQALNSGYKVLPVFVFDDNITEKLEIDDRRISFIFQAIQFMNKSLGILHSTIQIFKGKPLEIFKILVKEYTICSVFANQDYEPYAIQRDELIRNYLKTEDIDFQLFKDQVIFEKSEILNISREPYTVFTHYNKAWLEKINQSAGFLQTLYSEKHLLNFIQIEPTSIQSVKDLGFNETRYLFKPPVLNEPDILNYHIYRDFPALDATSRLSAHLRFGTVSIREMVLKAIRLNKTWLNEFIWREFFMQILWHFPNVVNEAFKPKYRFIQWKNDERDFTRWCSGKTGYPLVDSGMRQLNETGFMHNRVRMVTASFLVKHLLINWQWGEAYFASKLLDFELSSNNGNWQWAAGTGCDAAPYFRIFNPTIQAAKFDTKKKYQHIWIPEYDTPLYPPPIVEHTFARNRFLDTYKKPGL